MGENSKIEWTHHTFNPWTGCTKVSAACDNCYAENWSQRFKGPQWGHGQPRRLTTDANWRKPLKWNKSCKERGVRERVFCASLADVFDIEVADGWRTRLFSLIAVTQNLDWLLLTKRPKPMSEWFDNLKSSVYPPPWSNVWLGVTVENQKMANLRIPILLGTPAARRFVSCEPALELINLRRWLSDLDLVICGGETGAGARRLLPEIPKRLRDDCSQERVAFHFKQWGDFNEFGQRVGKKRAGRLLAGREWNEMPESVPVARQA